MPEEVKVAPPSAKQKEDSGTAVTADVAAAPVTPPTKSPCDEQPEQAKHDLDRAMVKWTRFMALITGALFVASILQFFVMRGQQIIMQGQLNAMEADQRPWIGAPTIKAELVSPDMIGFTHIFKNTGRTPTDGLWVDAVLVEGDNYNWLSTGKRLCDAGKAAAKIYLDKFHVFTQIPGDAWAVTWMPSTDSARLGIRTLQRSNIHISQAAPSMARGWIKSFTKQCLTHLSTSRRPT